jgi:AraC family transcriptional regulator
MDYIEHISKAVEYIEQNLINEIDITECAKACGYSVYHFLRVFKEITKLTPADYIRKRRICEIAKRICDNDEFISEIAFTYGFNSKENFVRAFKAEHHILPSEYKSAVNSLKLYERISFDKNPITVEPKIITLDSFLLTVYKGDEDYPPNFWNKYNARKYSLKLSGGEIVKDYGVCIWNSTYNKLDYFCGIRTEQAKGNVENTQQITINGGLYGVFATPNTTHANFVNTIHKTWEYINSVWLPNSEYNKTGGYEFECYIEKSRLFSEDIYIPLERK